MSDLFLGFVKVNETIDYNSVFMLIVVYFAIFWLVVSGWIFVDAKRRYQSVLKALIIFILTVIFGIPFLIVYFLVRPVDNEEIQETASGGINVPIINFTGKEGVVMSFELKINHAKFIQENDSEMKIDVNFATNDPDKKIAGPLDNPIEGKNVITMKEDSKDAKTGIIGNKVEDIKTKSGLLIRIKNTIALLKNNLKLKLKKKDKPKIKKDKEKEKNTGDGSSLHSADQGKKKNKKNKKPRQR